jgi:hypothetical protein
LCQATSFARQISLNVGIEKMKTIKPVILCSVVLIATLIIFFLLEDLLPIPIFGGGIEVLIVPLGFAIFVGKRIADRQVHDWQQFAKIAPVFFILSFILSFYLLTLIPNSRERNSKIINSINEPLLIKTERDAHDVVYDEMLHFHTNSLFNSSYNTTRVKTNNDDVEWIIWNRNGFKFKRFIVDAKTGKQK